MLWGVSTANGVLLLENVYCYRNSSLTSSKLTLAFPQLPAVQGPSARKRNAVSLCVSVPSFSQQRATKRQNSSTNRFRATWASVI